MSRIVTPNEYSDEDQFLMDQIVEPINQEYHLLKQTMKLETGSSYGATVTLGFMQRFASNDQVKAVFEGFGFTQVQIVGSGKIRTAKGLWAGATQEVELDSRLSNVEKL